MVISHRQDPDSPWILAHREGTKPMIDRSTEFMRTLNDLLTKAKNSLHHGVKRLDPGHFRRLKQLISTEIGKILSQPELLAQLSSSAYRHDNGFTKFVLAATSHPTAEVRLHHWSREAQIEVANAETSNIHNHTSSFTSIVLNGALRSTTYRESNESPGGYSSDSPYYAYRCTGRTDHEAYTLTARGAKSLAVLNNELVSAGEMHGLQNHVLHRIEPAQPDTVTLFMQGPKVVAETNVYSESKLSHLGTIPSPSLTFDQARSSLIAIHQVIGSP